MRTLQLIGKVSLWMGGLAMAAMMLNVALDILSKVLLGQPIAGTLELVTNWYMIACVFLPLIVVQQHRGQVSVEFFTQRLSPRARALLDGACGLVAFAYVLALALAGAREAIEQTAIGERVTAVAFDMIVWPTRWLVVIGYGGMALWLLMQSISDLRRGLGGTVQRTASSVDR